MRSYYLILLLLPTLSQAEEISFRNQIAPLFVERCLGCPNNQKMEGRYALHTFEMLMKAGESDEAPIVKGQADESYLYLKLVDPDPDLKMPQEDSSLTPEQLEMVRNWINQGAPFDGTVPHQRLTSLLPARRHPSPPETYRSNPPIFAIRFSIDDPIIFTGGWHEIIAWDIATGSLKKRIQGLPQRIHCIEYSPNRQQLAVGGGAPGEYGEIRLMDVGQTATPPSGDRHELLASWPDVVTDLCFTTDGSCLIAGGADNSVRCYDLKTRKEIWSNTQHIDWVTSVDTTNYRFAEQVVSNDQLPDFFTTNDNEKKSGSHLEQRWEFADKRFIIRKANWELQVDDDQTTRLTRVTTSGIGKTYRVQREDISGDSLIDHEPQIDFLLRLESEWPQQNLGSDFVFSSSKDRTVRVFSRDTGNLFTTYKGHRREYGPLKGLHRVYGVQSEPTTRRVWSVGEGQHLHGWNPVTVRDEDGTAADMEARFAKEYSIDLLQHACSQPVFALHRGQSHLFTAAANGEVKSFEIGPGAVFGLKQQAEKKRYVGHEDQLYSLDLSSSGLLAAAGFSGEITIWDLTTGQLVTRFFAAP